jgi:hypothetical protein
MRRGSRLVLKSPCSKGRIFGVWISCRYAVIVFGIPAREHRFLRCSSAVALRAMADKSVVDVHCLRCAPAKQSAPPDAESGENGFHTLITP